MKATFRIATGIVLPPRGVGLIPAMADKIKVAGIYTVPVQQKWVGTLHRADAAEKAGRMEYTYSEKVPNTDYVRVLREYAKAASSWWSARPSGSPAARKSPTTIPRSRS